MEDILNLLKEISTKLSDPVQKTTMTLRETAEYSGIGYTKLSELVHTENTDFPFFVVETRPYINRRAFDDWIEKVSEEHRKI